MKQEYQAPNATLIGFVSKQNLAVIFDFDDLKDMTGGNTGGESGTLRSEGDVDVPNT